MDPNTGDGTSLTGPQLLARALFAHRQADAWAIDVTGWQSPVKRDVMSGIGDPVLICFGTHRGAPCAFDPGVVGEHRVVVEVDGSDARQTSLAVRISDLFAREVAVVSRTMEPASAAEDERSSS